MNKQRFAVIIVAIIGMIATFLPWYRIVEVGTLSGVASSGWFTFIIFVVVIILALRKNLREEMGVGVVWSVNLLSLLAAFIVLWRIIDVWFAQEGVLTLGGSMEHVPGNQVGIQYGAWVVVAAGICVPLVAYLFRNHPFEEENDPVGK